MALTLASLMCLLPLAVCSEPKSWSFMQSVGGIAIGEAVERQGTWFLPVQANVAGLENITVKPAMLNSGLICASVSAKIVGESIFLTVNAGLLRDGYARRCPEASLGTPKAGEYRVFYGHEEGEAPSLGSIVIGTNK
jgi:hypothetical protein